MALEVPRFLQTKRYPAIELRRALQGTAIQAGVLAAADLKVTQRGAGANMSVDVAAGGAWVKGSFTARQGMYHVYNDAVANVAIATNSSGNPRLDQIVLRVHDTINGGGAQDAATLEVVQGTPTAGATLDNRSGAPALPTSVLRLADVLVANGAGSIANADIRDRRPWAHGAFSLVVQTSGADYTNAGNTSFSEIDATLIRKRIECSGAPMRMRLQGRASCNVATTVWEIVARMDGAALDGSIGHTRNVTFETGGHKYLDLEVDFVPPAGSHLFSWYWRALTASGTLTIDRGTDFPVVTAVEETIRQNASND